LAPGISPEFIGPFSCRFENINPWIGTAKRRPMMQRIGERQQLQRIASRLGSLKRHLRRRHIPVLSAHPRKWYSFLWPIKDMLGTVNADMSFIGMLLAHSYLRRKHPGIELDASTKNQYAPGLDIKAHANGTRIVGELKTTYPYGRGEFGANQHRSFLRDFHKLRHAPADRRYLFVTEPATFEILKAKTYRRYRRGVTVVLLDYGREFTSR